MNINPCKAVTITLWKVYQYTQSLEIYRHPSYLRKETAQGFYHEASGDLKTVTELNGCDMRNCGWINNIVVTP
jgi:hypothetical protein